MKALKINRKEIKKQAHIFFKRNFLTSVLLIFIFSTIVYGNYRYTSVLLNKNDNAKEIHETSKEEYEQLSDKEKFEVREEFRGVLSPIVSRINYEKSPLNNLYYAYKLFIYNHSIKEGIISLIAAILSLIIFFLLKLILNVGKNRFFLESRIYKKTSIFKLLFPYKSKDTFNISFILFLKRLFQVLWSFTIIGGIYKSYEFRMIPYILAENTHIKYKDAFKLSKEMMNGYKWQTFKLDLSLLGWNLLGLITLGFSNLLYYNAYKEYIYSELYYQIRNMKYNSLSNKKLLNDEYLFNNDDNLDKYPEDKLKIKTRKIEINTNYNQKYSVRNYILLFFTASFIGYSWEVLLHLIRDGKFVNRGTMFGPWLPIYGFGAILILLLLKPMRKNPILFFISAMVLAGIVEYSTAWFLETFVHMKWWDYTGYFLNIHGRVCLEGLIIFGLGGAAITYFLGPLLNNIFNKINYKKAIVVCILLLSFFATDIVYSCKHPNTGEGITS